MYRDIPKYREDTKDDFNRFSDTFDEFCVRLWKKSRSKSLKDCLECLERYKDKICSIDENEVKYHDISCMARTLCSELNIIAEDSTIAMIMRFFIEISRLFNYDGEKLKIFN